MGKTYLLWDEIHRTIAERASTIAAFKPDALVAIGGGGFIPGRLVRTFVPAPLYAVTVKLYDDADAAGNEPTVVQWLTPEAEEALRGKRVLVVDEVDDSRVTLAFVLDKLQKLDVTALGAFVIHNKTRPKKGQLPPNCTYIAGKETNGDDWVVYPWDATEIDEHNRNHGQ